MPMIQTIKFLIRIICFCPHLLVTTTSYGQKVYLLNELSLGFQSAYFEAVWAVELLMITNAIFYLYNKQVDKLKVLTESLANSISKSEKRIADHRYESKPKNCFSFLFPTCDTL